MYRPEKYLYIYYGVFDEYVCDPNSAKHKKISKIPKKFTMFSRGFAVFFARCQSLIHSAIMNKKKTKIKQQLYSYPYYIRV